MSIEPLKRAPYGPTTQFENVAFPIDVDKLLRSEFNRNDDLSWRAGLTLWLNSWVQTPIGSLPDNDEDLCIMAGLKTDIAKWKRIKVYALWKWQSAPDGRLYHPFITAKVLELIEAAALRHSRTIAATAARLAKVKTKPESSYKRTRKRADVTSDVTSRDIPKPSDVTCDVTFDFHNVTFKKHNVTSHVTSDVTSELSTGAYIGTRVGAPASDSNPMINPKSPLTPNPTPILDEKASARRVMELFDVSIVEIYGAENARPWPHQTDWQNAVEIAAMGLDLDELKFVFQTVCQKAKAQGKSMKVLSYTRYAIADVIASRQKAEAQPDAQSNPETAKSDVIAEMAEAAKMSPRSASGKLLVHFASHGMETEFRQQNARLALCADGKADLAELREWSQTELDRIEAGMRN